MGAVKQWELEKLGLATDLYTALADLVGDVEALTGTGASLSWRTADGHQGHWREEHGQFWVGRIMTDLHGAGTLSEQLVLTLESLGEGEERVGLAHPTVHHWRTADGHIEGTPVNTGRIYAAAQGLLALLREEMQTMLPSAREQEDEDEA